MYNTFSDGLLKMLYMILLHQQFRHPGAPNARPCTVSPSSMHALVFPSPSFSQLSTQPSPTVLLHCTHPLILSPPDPALSSLPDSDISNITLALQTLGSFNFGGQHHNTLTHYSSSHNS